MRILFNYLKSFGKLQKAHFFYVFYFFIAECLHLLITGCSISPGIYSAGSDYEQVVFSFPHDCFYAENYPDLLKWLVEIESAEISEKLETTDSHLCITVRKNEPLCIKATPITTYDNISENCFFKPAGTVYPYGSNKLSWEQGFTAEIMEILFRSRNETGLSVKKVNKFIGSFNWKKMIESIDDKIKKSEENILNAEKEGENHKTFYNPWQINESYLLENLSYRQFSAYCLNTKSVYTIDRSVFEGDFLLSSFVPENEIIKKYGFCTVKKEVRTSFICSKNKTAHVTYSSAKNISVSYLDLPILRKEL